MDNLRALTQNVDTAIPLNGGTASVLVENHNPLEKNIIEKAGKMTGFPFTSKRSPVGGVVPSGCLFWNGAAMNTTVNFDMFISKFTLDGNYFTRIADLIDTGAIMHFKDFVGRSVLFEVMQIDEEVDPENNEYLKLSVKGFAENLDYSYLVAEEEICMLEFLGNFKGSDYELERVGDTLNLLKNDVIHSSINLAIAVDAIPTDGSINPVSSNGVYDALQAIYQQNVLISSVPPTRSVNTFTYPLGQYEALINKTRRFNTNQFITTIGVAATDMRRVDVIYFKSDNTLAKQIGTESANVAARPDIPTDAVAVSFINVFGDTVSDPVPVTPEISLQNPFGVEQFKIKDYFRVKGATFYANEKLIEIDPLSSQIAYVSSTGNDATAELENSKKPYLTLDKAIAAIKTKQGTGLNWRIVFLSAGTFEVNNFGTFNWWVETELAVTISFKYAQCFFANYCIFKGNNLTLMISPTVVNSTLSCIGNTGTTVIDWDFATLDIRGVAVGQSNLGRMIQFTSCFVKQIRIKLVTVTGVFAAGGVPIISISTPVNDYDAVVFNYVTADTASSTLTLFSVGGTVLNSSITVLKSNSLGNWNIFNGIVPNGIKVRLGALLSTGYILVNAANLELLNGSMNSLYLTGLINLTGSATITYNTAYPTLTTKFVFAGSNRNTGIFCTIKNSKLTIIEGTVNQTTAQALFAVGDCAVELDNVQLNVNGTSWQPPVFQFVIKSTSLGTALLFKGDCYFDNLGGNLIIYRDGANGDDSASVDLSTVTEAKNRGTLRLAAGMSLSNRYDFEITDEKKDSIDYPNNRKALTIRTETKNLLVNRNLDSTYTYIIEGTITLGNNDYIKIPLNGITISGNGFETSKIVKNISGQSVFSNDVGGCGNVVIKDVEINSGLGGVFDNTDSDGTHAIEINDVNFTNCSSLGKIKGFRQFTGLTVGVYGCSNGFQLSGVWNGFSLTKLHVRTFATTGTLFRKDTDTVFSNRFVLDSANISGNTGIKVADFDAAIFSKDELFQITNSVFEVSGVINESNTTGLIPNITANDARSRWTNSTGITLTAVKFLDMKSADGNIWRLTVSNAGALVITDI